MHARLAQLVDFLEALVFRALSTHARPGHDRGGLAKLGRPFKAGLRHGLARADDRELCEAVDHIGFLRTEVIAGVELAHLRTILETEICALDVADGACAAAAFPQRAPEFVTIAPDRADNADAGDDDPSHSIRAQDAAGAASPGVAAAAPFISTSLITPSTMSRTLRMFFTSSSGTLMSNSFSSAKTMFTPSMESMPSSSKLLSTVTCAGSLRWVSAMMRRMRGVRSSGVSGIAVVRRFQNDIPFREAPAQFAVPLRRFATGRGSDALRLHRAGRRSRRHGHPRGRARKFRARAASSRAR